MKKYLAFPPLQIIFGSITIASLLLAIATEIYLLAAIPLIFLLAYTTIADYRTVYLLMLACLPLSTEFYFPNGLATDLPTEPIIIGLMLVFLFLVLYEQNIVEARFLKHPITLLLLLHFSWIAITTITSSQIIFSTKYLLAKTWYIIVFYFFAGSLFRQEKQIKTAFWWILIPLLFTLVYVNLRHAQYGFSFEDIYKVLHPFYRNHVIYACLMVIFFPFVWYALYWYWEQPKIKWLLIISIIFLLVSIYFSYTRAAYVALLIMPIGYLILRLKLIPVAIIVGVLSVSGGIIFLAKQNKYLAYAPNYERTITHTEFNSLLEATYNLEDISTMERFHRWVAAFFMIKEKPLLGFGPGNFYSFYTPFTVNSFRTYVSDNPEQSGIHNYYLMVAVEQGIIGLLIFLLLCSYVLWKSQVIYYQTSDKIRRTFIIATFFAFIIICIVQTMNDLIETDKVGAFFFICMSILVNLDLRNQSKRIHDSRRKDRTTE